MRFWCPSVVVALSLLATACAASSPPVTATARLPGRADCVPRFTPNGAWIVADGGRSIPLPNGSAVHLFGDTLLEPRGSTEDKRASATGAFVGNTVGIGYCSSGGYRLEYYFRAGEHGPRAIFDDDDSEIRLWPVDGFFHDNKLYVLLGRIRAVPHGIGFEYTGALLATVDNPFAMPSRWRVEYAPLASTEPYQPTLGIAVQRDQAYVFSTLESESYPAPAILLRLPLSGLDEPRKHLQYLSRGGTYEPISSFDRTDAAVVLEAASTTMYAHWHAGLERWIAIHADPEFGSPDMVLRTASRLEGPWSAPRAIYRFPEMLPRFEGPDGLICYAVTEHAQLRRDEGRVLTVTYACNQLAGALPTRDELDAYRPKPVLIGLENVPPAPSGDRQRPSEDPGALER